MTETDNQRVSVCNSAPFVVQEYATAHGPGWCAIDPGSGIVIATATQPQAIDAAHAMNAAYRLGAQIKWCETVPETYADAASELMAASEAAACGFDVLADDHLHNAQKAITRLRGGREAVGGYVLGPDAFGAPVRLEEYEERAATQAFNERREDK
jgi:hypothetical protein